MYYISFEGTVTLYPCQHFIFDNQLLNRTTDAEETLYVGYANVFFCYRLYDHKNLQINDKNVS